MSHSKRRDKRRKKRKIKDLVLLSFIIVVCASFIFVTLSYVVNPPPIEPPEPPSLFAAIVDPLSVTQLNQTFIDKTKTLMEEAGFEVDVYGCESVTVDFYRILASIGYDLIVFRTHSGILMNASGQPIPGDPVFLFTAEEYDPNKHIPLLWNDLVAPANPWDTETFYFAISPKFVKETMQGQFYDTVIIINGCHGLYSTTLADALIERGASAIISWDEKVTAPHMDSVTIYLLNELLNEGKTLDEAIEETGNVFGPDPTGGVLSFYPDIIGNLTIRDLITF